MLLEGQKTILNTKSAKPPFTPYMSPTTTKMENGHDQDDIETMMDKNIKTLENNIETLEKHLEIAEKEATIAELRRKLLELERGV